MNNAAIFRLVLLVSCCHALVHVYELSLGWVEKDLVEDSSLGIYDADDDSLQKPDPKAAQKSARHKQREVSGELANCLRWPFGFVALLAGWMADRYGTKRLLLIYLVGCSAAALLVGFTPNLTLLYIGMFALGLFAGIYHPAGVALISHQTTAQTRTMALSYHGVFGSAGIAAGPLLAGLVMHMGATWRQYYLVLGVPGVLLAVLVAMRLPRNGHEAEPAVDSQSRTDGRDTHWRSYCMLLGMACVAGLAYAAIFHFMSRYLGEAVCVALPQYVDETGKMIGRFPVASLRNYTTSAVLLLGIIGQYAAGRIAKPSTLEPLTACSFLGAAPFVLLMGVAEGGLWIAAAAAFSPIFFMHQPLYNSLVAKYVPRRRRSLCYGLSFTMGFGVGSFGPNIVGRMDNKLLIHAILAGLLCLAGAVALVLWRWHGPVIEDH